jgi:hypothetical protein
MVLGIARRAYIAIERKINKTALLPVGHEARSHSSPLGNKEMPVHVFSIDIFPLTGNSQNRPAHSII